MNKSIIKAVDLQKRFHEGRFDVNVLTSVNFDVAAGECVAIIGQSGSGKSTLLHLLGGLDQPSGGQVYWGEKLLSDVHEKEKCALRNMHIGFVYQFHHLLPEFTALENIAIPLLIAKQKPSVARARAMTLLSQIGLEQRAQHKLAALSGGERQRVAFARALATSPACILADEPTGNLDVATGQYVFELMLELQRACQTTFVMVTHDERLAKRADRVLVLSEGRLSV